MELPAALLLQLALIAAAAAAAAAGGGRCESHWTQVGEQCYQLLGPAQRFAATSWSDARSQCESLAAHLVDKGDAASLNVARSISSSSRQQLWLADCATVSPHDSRDPFTVTNCQQQASALCVKPVSECPVGWYQQDKKCLQMSVQQLSWDEANSVCSGMGGDLLQVKDKATQDFVNAYLPAFARQGVTHIWIGLYQIKIGDKEPIEWTSGGNVDNFHQNWAADQPKLISGERNSVWMDANDEEGRWSMAKPTLQRGYICELPVGKPPIQPTADTRFSCPEGWSLFRGSCYNFNAHERSWSGARDSCKQQNAQLVDIRDDGEQEFVQRHLSGRHMWIGLHSKPERWGEWYWNDDTEVATYFNWAEGEPNNHDDNEFCVQMFGNNGMWNDAFCHIFTYYSCKRPADLNGPSTTPKVTPTTPHGAVCGPGWYKDPFSDFCYQFHLQPMTWQDARLYCQSVSGELASITSLNEKNFISGQVRALAGAGASVLGYWIGFNDLAVEFRWVWSDGSPVSLVNWDFGEPNKMHPGENCVHLYSSTLYWNDARCNEQFAVVCKKLGDVPPTTKPPATTIEVPPGKVRGCPSGYSGFGHMCYGLFEQKASWHGARQRCRDDGGDLVSYADRREFDFVFDLVQQQGDYEIWIGMYDTLRALRTMYFQWSDGSPVTFTNWNTGEPNDYTDDEDCVEQYGRDKNGEWNDMKCDRELSFVCKRRELVMDQTPTPQPPPEGCPEDYDDAFDGMCYKYVVGTEAVTWPDAQNRCGGNPHLVTITSAAVQRHINLRLYTLATDTPFWIGLVRSFFGTFTWARCCRLGSNSYTNWQLEANTRSTYGVANPRGVDVGTWTMVSWRQRLTNYICQVRQQGPTTTPRPPTTYDPRFCAEGWVEADDTCYKPFYASSGTRRWTWTEARYQCQLLGGDLASIHSPNASQAIGDVIRAGTVGYWIGLNSRANSKELLWSDGSSGNFFNWKKDEPNNHNGRLNCAMVDSRDMQWSVTSCSVRNNWICQTPKGINPGNVTTPEPTTRPDLRPCPLFYRRFGDFCYRTSTLVYDWYGAREYCRRQGGDLVSILSPEENDFLLQMASRFWQGRTYWIGLNELGQTDGFRWTDGSPVGFVNWNVGQPNNAGGAQHCVSMRANQGLWDDQQCGSQMRAICKRNNETEGRTEAPTTPMPGECPTGYHTVGDKCYRVFGAAADTRNWTEALRTCSSAAPGGRSYLASVSDEYDQATLTWLARDAEVDLWIGLHTQRSIPRNYVWIDNARVTYANWDRGEPNGNIDNQENCVEMYSQKYRAGRWNDIRCDRQRGYICMTYKRADIRTTWPGPSPTRTLCNDPQWRQFGTACFRLFTTAATWSSALQQCRSVDADLASVHDVWEQNFLVSLTRESRQQQQTWIGLSDTKTPGVFVWSDGWPVLYSFWGDGMPDDSGGKSCVSVPANGRWQNADCGTKLPYLCRHSFGSAPTTPETPPGSCPDGLDQFGGSCYFFSDTRRLANRRSFADARMDCSFRGGDLVSITSQAEQDFLARAIDYRTQTQTSRVTNFWVGMTRQSAGGFQWTDRSPVSYIHWAEGAPSGKDGAQDLNCVEMYHLNYRWNDQICSTANGYVCKIKLVPGTTGTQQTGSAAPKTKTPETTMTTKTTMGRRSSSSKPEGVTTQQQLATGNPGPRPEINRNRSSAAVILVFTLLLLSLVAMVIGVVVYKRRQQLSSSENEAISNANWSRDSGSVQLHKGEGADGFENPSFKGAA